MRILLALSVVGSIASVGASAQTKSAYQSGLDVARTRGYAPAECYARVFARHAVVSEKPGGRRSWYAASTPAYNREQKARCGVDRLQDMAALRDSPRNAAPGEPRVRGGIYGLGRKTAAERGYSGSQANCYARTFAAYASPAPAAPGRVRYVVSGRAVHAYTQQLARDCGISR